MKKEIIIGALSAGLALMMGLTALAQTASSTTTHSTESITTKITCVGTAVNAREQAVDSAVNAYTQALNSAYTARATALQQAYTQTTKDAVKTAINKAWSDFRTAIKTARNTFVKARHQAWSDFRKAALQCKAEASLKDTAKAGYEISGQ